MPNEKFRDDLANCLSEIAQVGAKATSVTALMVYIRRVIEDANTKKDYKFANVFGNWSVHTSMSQDKVVFEILDAINHIIIACLKMQHEGILIKDISKTLSLENLRSDIVEICCLHGIDASLIQDDKVWGEIRHQLLNNLCEVPLSIFKKEKAPNLKKYKFLEDMIAKYPSAAQIISSIVITEKLGSTVLDMEGGSHYWCIDLIDMSNMTAPARRIIGAVSH